VLSVVELLLCQAELFAVSSGIGIDVILNQLLVLENVLEINQNNFPSKDVLLLGTGNYKFNLMSDFILILADSLRH